MEEITAGDYVRIRKVCKGFETIKLGEYNDLHGRGKK